MPAIRRSAIALATACGLMALEPVAFAMQSDDLAQQARTYYLEAFLNGRDSGYIVRVDKVGGRFVIAADELNDIGVRTDDLPLDADRQIALDDWPGLRYEYRENEQRLDLTLAEAQLVPERIGYQSPPPPAPQSGRGLVLNYATHLQSTRVELERKENARRVRMPLQGAGRYGDKPLMSEEEFDAYYEHRNRTFTAFGELRLFSGAGVLVNSGYFTMNSGRSSFLRQDSYWTYTDVDAMHTWTAGDYVGSSLAWSRSVRFGGISLSRNFEVRPDLVTFPVPALGGTAVVPTTVDLYINGLRQMSGEATGGPFVFANAPAVTGAGMARIVFDDPFGRQVAIERPLYVDPRLLAPRTSDYAVQIGYPRRAYGSRSFDYADTPAANASLRYGVTDAFTLEAHTELADGLHNLGVGGLLRLSRFGVINASASGSGGDGSGTQFSFGYQYLSPAFSVSLQGITTQDDYRDIGSLEGSPIPERQWYAAISMPIGQRHSVTLAHSRQEASQFGGSNVFTLSYNGMFGRRTNVFANLFRDSQTSDSLGVYLGVIVNLGPRTSMSVSATRYGDERTLALAANRSIDYDNGGFGWNVQVDAGNDDFRHGMGRLDYRGRYGDASLQVEHSDLHGASFTNTSLFTTGALVYMGRDLMATRQIYDSFGLVSTGDLADVPVLRENRLVGTTNDEGHLIIPDLLSYRTNRLAIDTLGLPVDVLVEADRLEVAPRGQSGVLVRFPVGRYRGASVILVDERQQPLPVGTGVTLDNGETAIVGYDGLVFLPSLQDDNRLRAELDDGTFCDAMFAFDASAAATTLGPVVCRPVAP